MRNTNTYLATYESLVSQSGMKKDLCCEIFHDKLFCARTCTYCCLAFDLLDLFRCFLALFWALNDRNIASKKSRHVFFMKLFQNTDFVINNCGKINEFSSKVMEICKNKDNSPSKIPGSSKSSKTPTRLNKRN